MKLKGNKNTKVWLGVAIALLVIVVGVAIAFSLKDKQPQNGDTPTVDMNKPEIYKDSSAAIEDRVADLLSRMTIEEKVGQMVQAERASIAKGDITKYYLGSILSGGGSWPNGDPETNTPADWVAMIDGMQDEALATKLGIPILYGVDAVHGHNNVYGATLFPHNVGLGAANNPELVTQIGQAVSEEISATGAHWNFAPTIVGPENFKWGRSYEGFSENLDIVASLGAAYIKGLQGATIDELKQPVKTIGTAKHFIGEGATENGVNQGDVTHLTEEEVVDLYIQPYIDAVNAGVRTVMPSYNSIQGQKAHGSKYLLTDVLKGELGFTGFVISDYNAIQQLPGTFEDQVRQSVNAGVDMLMVPQDWKNCITTLKKLVNSGDISEERINDAVTRILRVKFESGLFESPKSEPGVTEAFGTQEHKDLARQAVRESLVLLKNDDKIMEQLKDFDKIFVAGKNANDLGNQCGGWTITWQGKSDTLMDGKLPIGPSTIGTTILEGITRALEGTGKEVKFNKMGRGAEGYDVAIVVLGETPYAEGSGDKSEINLDLEDISTLENIRAAAPDIPIIVVMVSGRPMMIGDYVNDWAGLVAAWLPGTEGEGVADVLFGDYDFTGKLPISWPWYMEQLPRPFDKPEEMLFPFGHGLTKSETYTLPTPPAKPTPVAQKVVDVPRFEAEAAIASGVDYEDTTDEGGGQNAGWIDAGDWFDFYLDAPAGLYEVSLRVAVNADATVSFKDEAGSKIGESVALPASGGWQNWSTITGQIVLKDGVQKVRLQADTAGWNMNWVEFKRVGDIPADFSVGGSSESVVTIPSSPVLAAGKVNVWWSSETPFTKQKSWYYSPKPIEFALTQQAAMDLVTPDSWDVTTITVDPAKQYQTFLGMGSSFEESTVYNLYQLSAEKRTELLTKLVGKDGANMTLMRTTIGTADFTGRTFYTYADLPYAEVPQGETEDYYVKLLEDNFSIEKDKEYHITDTLKEALAINPDLKLFASPWTPPGWMKTEKTDYARNDLNLMGGSLKSEFIPVLAKYFRMYVEAYAAEGIPLYGITLQNEPELEIEYPSCRMTSDQEKQLAIAVKKEFEESFAAGKITAVPKIWVFDHNFSSGANYVKPIMDDAEGAAAVDGFAFHDYGGEPTTMTEVENLYPDKDVALTERAVWGTAGADRIAQYFRNYAVSYNSWVTMLDSDIYPEQWTGVPDPTMIIRDSGNVDAYWETPEYYLNAQFTKFIQPGAVRIDSNYGSADTVTNVAFMNPNGDVVVVVINQTAKVQPFKIVVEGKQVSATLPGGTVATYVISQ